MARTASSEMVEWHRLSPPDDPFGISCDEDGPSIGPVRMLERTSEGWAPRPASELAFIFESAFDRPIDFAAKAGGLRAAARALNEGDLPRAMIATLLMRLPPLPDDAALYRAISADTLAKAGFDPNEPRDEQGRWTSDNQGFDSFALIPIRSGTKDPNDYRCDRQYEEDAGRCRTLVEASDRAKCYAVAGDRLGDCKGGREPRPFIWRESQPSAPPISRPASPSNPSPLPPWWPLLLPILGGIPA